jgi:phosphoglycerate dehydrogenase-like enzyme
MFGAAAIEALESFAEVIHAGDEPAGKTELIDLLADADACITSWGVHQLDTDVVAAAPHLTAMAHMGSSVKRFVSASVWQREIAVTSAGVSLAKDVAETTLGLMIVGRKRVWPLGQHVRQGGWRDSPTWDTWNARELTRSVVGIIGASNVGRHVIELLKPFEVEILLTDPYMREEDAEALGVRLVDLDEMLRTSDTVSLHCPSNEHTRHLLGQEAFDMMKDDALLINTARGELIDEAALCTALADGRFFAFLDVCDPEPPPLDSPLRSLPNVVLTPHIAGCIDNCNRMGELAVEELRRHFAGEQPVYRITEDMLDRIA